MNKKINSYTLYIYMRMLFCVCLFSLGSNLYSQITVDINSGNPAFPFPQFLPYEWEGGHYLDKLATRNSPLVPHAEM